MIEKCKFDFYNKFILLINPLNMDIANCIKESFVLISNQEVDVSITV